MRYYFNVVCASDTFIDSDGEFCISPEEARIFAARLADELADDASCRDAIVSIVDESGVEIGQCRARHKFDS